MVLRLTGIAVLVVLCASTGCRKASNEAIESAIESQMEKDGGKANVEIDNDGISMKFQNEQGESTISSGQNVAIPAQFPKDIPLYAQMKVAMVNTQKQEEMFTIQAASTDALEKVAAFFQQEVPKQEWKEEATFDSGSEMKSLSYTKENRTLQVMLTHTDEGTTIVIMTSKKD